MQTFRARLAASAARARSWLCVGLDPEPARFPEDMTEEDVLQWSLGVVHAVADHACAVKANAAFFEALGAAGVGALEELAARLPPALPLILDGKRNDVGHSAAKYAEAAFDVLGVDAVTVTPYLGRDTVAPFAEYPDRGVFLLARTSNPSAREFQDLPVGPERVPLYQAVARQAMAWDKEWGTLGLVAGATYPEELSALRAICGDGVPLLIPGVGAQGGDAQEAVRRGSDAEGAFALVNVGRAVTYPTLAEGADWQAAVAQAARDYARRLAPPQKGQAR